MQLWFGEVLSGQRILLHCQCQHVHQNGDGCLHGHKRELAE
jgi:hypothetical protein